MKQSTISNKINLEQIVSLSTTIVNRLERIHYNKTEFSNDDFIRDSFIPPLLHIGEIVKELSPELAERVTNNQARAIIAMRNRLAHAYLAVDNQILWDTIITSIPELGMNTAKTLESDFDMNCAEDIRLYTKVLQEIERRR